MQNKKKSNFIFWGTPYVASETLEILKENDFLPTLIVTNIDKPQGRKMILTSSPVKIWAKKNSIPYLQPERLDAEFMQKLKELIPNLNFSIVVAYGKIIPEKFLNLPKLDSLNVHYSLLPKYRGASPVESVILNGETETGVSIQKMIYQMDAGDILAEEATKIEPTEKAEELKKRLINIGGSLLVKILPDFLEGKITPKKQDESKATFCKKMKKEYGLIDLNDDPKKNYNKFRAYAYWPRTFFFKDGKRYIITDAVLENDQFIIKKVIPEGRKEVEYKN